MLSHDSSCGFVGCLARAGQQEMQRCSGRVRTSQRGAGRGLSELAEASQVGWRGWSVGFDVAVRDV